MCDDSLCRVIKRAFTGVKKFNCYKCRYRLYFLEFR